MKTKTPIEEDGLVGGKNKIRKDQQNKNVLFVAKGLMQKVTL